MPWRRCDAFVRIRAGDLAVTAIRPDGARERSRTNFGPIELAIIVEAAHIRGAGTIHGSGRALSIGQNALTDLVPFTGNLGCQGLRELSIDWLSTHHGKDLA